MPNLPSLNPNAIFNFPRVEVEESIAKEDGPKRLALGAPLKVNAMLASCLWSPFICQALRPSTESTVTTIPSCS